MKYKYTIEFEADSTWQPLGRAICSYGCPFKDLTKFGQDCLAKQVYEESSYRAKICPFFKGHLTFEEDDE